MIGRLRGHLVWRDGGRAVVDVQGVGYEMSAPQRDLDAWAAEGDAEIVVVVSTQVREDAINLYGFASWDEREAFDVLLSVSGIGAKLALTLLDGLDLPTLRRAVETDDLTTLGRVNGIGRKTAQRLALELKGKLPSAGFVAPATRPTSTVSGPDAFEMALTRLGWSRPEIESARARVEEAGLGGAPAPDRVRHALKTSLRS
jgi:Holliday junction DNA helicase RuvA